MIQCTFQEKPHKCKLCEKSFPTPGDLRSHMYVHDGSWPFRCDVCNRGFSKQTNLKNHLLLHTGDKPHECPVCQKKFALHCNLKTHMKTHEGKYQIALLILLNFRSLDKSAWLKIIFLIVYQNICCVYSKEPSQWDGSFEHPKHIFKLMDKNIITILRSKNLVIWSYKLKFFLSFLSFLSFFLSFSLYFFLYFFCITTSLFERKLPLLLLIMIMMMATSNETLLVSIRHT